MDRATRNRTAWAEFYRQRVEAAQRVSVETQFAMLRVDQVMDNPNLLATADLRELRSVSNTSCDMDDETLDDTRDERFGMHWTPTP